MRWSPDDVIRSVGGSFSIVFSGDGLNTLTHDVTYFRGKPSILESYSYGDPFGAASAVITFPQISAYDDLQSPELSWLTDYASVDIFWHEAESGSTMFDPLTNQETLQAPDGQVETGRTKIWEGYVASMEISIDEGGSSLQVQCQGALYQLDRYLQKPFFPPRPWPMERLITDVFSHTRKPHLRTKPLKIEWPVGWTKVVPAYTSPNIYTPVAKPGTKYSGFSSRATGSWDHALTGFCADLLAVMYTDDDSGVISGNQWSIRSDPGRQPVLYVRDRFRDPDFELWLGTQGVTVSVTRDTTQTADIIYGEGTGLDGTIWRNAVVSNDGTRTDYKPLAADPRIYPFDQKYFDSSAFASEAFINYGSGMQLDQAIESTEKKLKRDREPGMSGSMTLKVDPDISRYTIRSGMTVKIKGIAGSGISGVNFHIAEVEVDVQGATVTCKIDTKYRDLLTLEEAQQRTRDPLTPTKMLQVNRRSVLIEDIMAPWDYSAGSGFVPKRSKRFHANRPNNVTFPWTTWLHKYPPRSHGDWYVKVKAHKAKTKDRWTLGKNVPILTSEKGSIRRVEVVCCDIDGNIVEIDYHFSIYYNPVTVSAMPHIGANYSPFQTGAFESTSPTGQPWPAGNFLAPDPSIVIGWGNLDQPAGHSPGLASEGYPATGLLVDDSTWSYDNTNNPNFDKNAKVGATQPASAITLYGAFYAHHTKAVFFMARMYKQEAGT